MTKNRISSISHCDIPNLIKVAAESSPSVFLQEQSKYITTSSRESPVPESGLDIDMTSYGSNEKFPRVLNISLGNRTSIMNKGTSIEVTLEHPQALNNLAFDSGLFLIIRMSHALEHLTSEEIDSLLIECNRILSRHGELHVGVWGLEKQCEHALSGIDYNPKTLFSQSLLEYFLSKAEFSDITAYPSLISFDPGHKVKGGDSTDCNAFASHKKIPHTIDSPLGEKAFIQKCRTFKNKYSELPDVSFVITIYNEAANLPHFLSFLENIKDETGMRREFIFVLNGCTDDSENILHDFLKQTFLTAKVVTSSEKGILPAFKKGMNERVYNGLVGRFDADIFLHPHTLDLMQMHLQENQSAQVTYAEPVPMDSPSVYNDPWYNPHILSKRLYYTGKTSLYRQNPHLREDIRDMPPDLVADDIFTSFYFAYFYGLDSISRTPHALVYEKVVNNFEDLVSQQSRCDSEIARILEAYPHFNNLNGITVQSISPGPYLDLINKAKKKSTYVEGWIRLESTK